MAAEARSNAAAPGVPWLAETLADVLRTHRGHALLLHGAPGRGQFELAIAIASAWLCDAPRPEGACGACASCKLVAARTHPDLVVVVPEALAKALGWTADDEVEGGKSERKPSKEIKVDAVRSAIGFAQTTSARGRGKVAVFFPAERINTIGANTLLKTLEEPAGDARFVMACGAADALPATVRSRCQAIAMPVPPAAVAAAWLSERGVADPEVLLAATGGSPQQALAWAQEGLDASAWRELPRRLARGDAQALAGWPLARAVDALQRLCHDALRRAVGAPPRYFAPQALAGHAALPALLAWAAELRQLTAHVEHPWHAPLALDSLVLQAQRALAPPR